MPADRDPRMAPGHAGARADRTVARDGDDDEEVPETCMEQCIGKCVDLTQIHKGPVGIWGPGEGGGCCTAVQAAPCHTRVRSHAP